MLLSFVIDMQPLLPGSFTPLQRAVLDLVARGLTLSAACNEVGIVPTAGNQWCHQYRWFDSAVDAARNEAREITSRLNIVPVQDVLDALAGQSGPGSAPPPNGAAYNRGAGGTSSPWLSGIAFAEAVPEDRWGAPTLPPEPTPEAVQVIAEGLATGMPRKHAAALVGLELPELHQWCLLQPEITKALSRAEAKFVASLVVRIGQTNRWQAAAWLLERLHSDEFGEKETLTVKINEVLAEARTMAKSAGLDEDEVVAEARRLLGVTR